MDVYDVKFALAVSSGTAALIVAMAAAGIGPGDEVIVPGYTFIASMSSVIFCNAVPVLAEVDQSLTLDPKDVESRMDMSLEMVDIVALDTGKYHAMVVQDPYDKRSIKEVV